MNVPHMIRGHYMDKITVQRANVILDISPEQKDYYLSQGYSVINANGLVIEETRALTVDALNRKVAELQQKLKEKEAAIQKMGEEMIKLKAQLQPVKKTRSKRED